MIIHYHFVCASSLEIKKEKLATPQEKTLITAVDVKLITLQKPADDAR
jgi:hypothetical protein